MFRRSIQIILTVWVGILSGSACGSFSTNCDAMDASCNDGIGYLILNSFLPTTVAETAAGPTLTVTSGLILWLQADAITGLNDNDPVTSWSDSSGQGNNASAATAPTYKTNIINNLPVVRFTATGNTGMTIAGFSRGAMTILTVAMGTSAGGGSRILIEQSANTNFNNGFYIWNSNVCGFLVNNGSFSGRDMVSNTWLNDDDFKTLGFAYDGTHASHLGFMSGFDNLGTSCGAFTADPGTSVVTDTLNIGARNQASNFFDGDVAEILIYDRALNSTEIAEAECYLSVKYALTTLRTCN